ncbi:hypothetical protein FRC01_000049 [Tulasnella sp. 417]|nr:hypothetical protein FRC01_000049 [Tulasnella sp. 417]
MTGITAVIGAQTSFAMNPARDLGPRMMSAMFYGRQVFTFRNNYWIWGPIIADFTGALAGATVYDLLIYVGTESPIAYRPVSPSSDPPTTPTAQARRLGKRETPPSPTATVHARPT